MRNKAFVLFVVLLIVSCNKVQKPPKPDSLISEDQMVHMLFDLSLLSSAKGTNKKLLEKKGVNMSNYIYEKYNIDSTQFASSINYYTYNLETIQSIYKRVEDSLNILKKQLDKKVKRDLEEDQQR